MSHPNPMFHLSRSLPFRLKVTPRKRRNKKNGTERGKRRRKQEKGNKEKQKRKTNKQKRPEEPQVKESNPSVPPEGNRKKR